MPALAMNLCPVEGLGSVSRKGKKLKDEKERRYTKRGIATLPIGARKTFCPKRNRGILYMWSFKQEWKALDGLGDRLTEATGEKELRREPLTCNVFPWHSEELVRIGAQATNMSLVTGSGRLL